MTIDNAIGLAVTCLGVSSLISMYIASTAKQQAQVAFDLSEKLGRGLIELSNLVEETDESLTKSIDAIRRRVAGGETPS